MDCMIFPPSLPWMRVQLRSEMLADAVSLVCRLRIEEHSLLPDLYFAVPGFAGALVHVQDCAGRRQLRVDKAEAVRDRPFAEEAFARAEHHGELPDPQRIDKITLEQSLEEMAAAMDLELIAVLRFERGDLLGNVTLEQDRVAPGDFIERPRSHELRPGVECGGNLVGRIRGLGQEPAKIS